MKRRLISFVLLLILCGTSTPACAALDYQIATYADYKDKMWDVVREEPCLRTLRDPQDTYRVELIFLLHKLHFLQYPLKYFCDDNGTGKPWSKKHIELLFDSHTSYRVSHREIANKQAGIGIGLFGTDTGIFISSIKKGDVAARAGLKRYDRIVRVDNIPAHDVWQVAGLITGEQGTYATITVERNHELLIKTLRREIQRYSYFDNVFMTSTRIGYIKIDNFHGGMAREILAGPLQNFKHYQARGIILDLRDNPGGLISEANRLLGYFLGVKTTLLKTTPAYNLFLIPFSSTEPQGLAGDHWLQEVPLVVLVDRFSYSSAEIVAAALALQKRATVVGEDTGGKGTFQDSVTLRSGKVLSVTTGRWSLIDGSSIDKKGLVPEIDLKSYAADTAHVRAHLKGVDRYFLEDEDLMKAIEILEKKLQTSYYGTF